MPRRRRPLLIGVVVVLLLAVLGVLFWVWSKPATQETSQTAIKRDISLLRVSTPDGPINQIYPNVSNADSTSTINTQIFEGLVTYEGITKIVPLLATSWTNPDNETWLFDLKHDVQFHTGRTMTADDVKYSLDKYKDKAWEGVYGTTIKSVQVVDSDTVKITTDGPDPLLLNRLVHLYVIDSKAKKDGDAVAGTGAYVIKAGTKPTASTIDLVAFDSYHGGHVYTREVLFKQKNNDAAVKAFNDGKIDVAAALTNGFEDLKLANQRLLTHQGPTVTFFGINTVKTGSPLRKLAVRQALMLALDPAAIITANKVDGQPIDQFVTPDIPGYNADIARPALNRAKAKQLLSSAGYPNGFTLKLSYGGDAKGLYANTKKQLAEIGITLKEDYYGDDFDSELGTIFGGAADLFFIGYEPDLLDGSDTFNTIFNGKDDTGKPINYGNDKLDSLLTKANKTLDGTTRLATLQQVATILSDDVAAIPLYTRSEVTATAGPYVMTRDFTASGAGVFYRKVYTP